MWDEINYCFSEVFLFTRQRKMFFTQKNIRSVIIRDGWYHSLPSSRLATGITPCGILTEQNPPFSAEFNTLWDDQGDKERRPSFLGYTPCALVCIYISRRRLVPEGHVTNSIVLSERKELFRTIKYSLVVWPFKMRFSVWSYSICCCGYMENNGT